MTITEEINKNYFTRIKIKIENIRIRSLKKLIRIRIFGVICKLTQILICKYFSWDLDPVFRPDRDPSKRKNQDPDPELRCLYVRKIAIMVVFQGSLIAKKK